jgi:hypothetical protein
MADRIEAPEQHLSTIPLDGALMPAASTPGCSAFDEAEYAEALATETEALTLEARELLDRSARLSLKLRSLHPFYLRKELNMI